MRLSDIMSKMNLAVWAEIGLILFLFAFGLILITLLFFSPRENMQRFARLPLDDDLPQANLNLNKTTARNKED